MPLLDTLSSTTAGFVPLLAQADAGAGGPGGILSNPMFMVAAIVGIMYFLIFRPQQKEAKEHEKMLSALQKGDQVVTSSGMHGKVHMVEDDLVIVEIADKVRVTIDKTAVKRKLGGEG
jgi:preprotein translocase subunit YajC